MLLLGFSIQLTNILGIAQAVIRKYQRRQCRRREHLSEHKQFLNRSGAPGSFLNEVVGLDFSLLGLFRVGGSKRRYVAYFRRWHCHRDNVMSHTS